MIVTIGTQATCAMCGEAIIWNGQLWTHLFKSYRHPAIPAVEQESDELEVESYTVWGED